MAFAIHLRITGLITYYHKIPDMQTEFSKKSGRLVGHVGIGIIVLIASTHLFADTATDTLRALVEQASRDLRHVRGTSLTKTPPVVHISPERYVEEYVVRAFDATWGGDFDRSLEVFKALGMLPADLEAKPFLRRYGAAMTVAAYDFFEKRILFPRTEVSPDVLLHELVHAMQDERHDILKLMRTTGFEFDRTLAMGALFEGEALNVQIRYTLGGSRVLAGLSPYGTLRREARARFETARQHWIDALPDIPENLIRAQAFVYDEGVLFVERLRRRKRNWAAVDAAYAMPPRSTAQILHPEKYINGEWPVEMTLRDKEKRLPEYALVAENTLGEFGTRLFLQTHRGDLAAPEKLVEGWRGDRVFLYRRKGIRATVLVWVSRWSSPAQASSVGVVLHGVLSKFRDRLSVIYEDCSGGHPQPIEAFMKVSGPDLLLVVGGDRDGRKFESVLTDGLMVKTREGKPFGDEEEKAK